MMVTGVITPPNSAGRDGHEGTGQHNVDRTLVRQLRALGIDPTQPSATPEELARLLSRVSETYTLQRRLRQRLRGATSNRELDRAAAAATSRFEQFFHLASDAMFTATLDGYITGANEALANLTGLKREELIGRAVASIVAQSSIEPMLAMRRTKFRDPDVVTRYEVELQHVDGTVVPVELASQFERLDGRPYEILAIARDIRERRAREATLRDQAERDPLTGLPNRTRLLAELDEMAAATPDVPSALAMVDLDRFKEINDTLGHEAGDRVLIAVARAMTSAAEHHTVGRLAGDEFVVLMRGASVGEATAIAERIRLAISHVSVPARGEHIHPQASIGVATIRQQVAPQAILAAADAALYAAKEGGRNRVVVEAQPERHRRDFGDFLMADAVFDAIADDRLELVYEPILRLTSGEPMAHRAQLRMRSPDGTITPYESFAGAMERVGALPTVDRCAAALVTQALRQHPALRAVLRISASAARDTEVFAFIEQALIADSSSGVRLLIEIAEFTGSLDHEAQRAALERLRGLGCGVSLCEPGSGYGVLNIARDVPLTAITLGEALTQSLQTNPRSRALAHAVQSMADALGIQTLADGIETPEQLAVVREIGVALGAGALLGRPTRAPMTLIALTESALAEAS